jgi:hypothetical protein
MKNSIILLGILLSCHLSGCRHKEISAWECGSKRLSHIVTVKSQILLVPASVDNLMSMLGFEKVENGHYLSEYKNSIFEVHYITSKVSSTDSSSLNLQTEIVYCGKHNTKEKVEQMITEFETYHHFHENGVQRLEFKIIQ